MPICPICERDVPALVSDHCHKTGISRDDICTNCNVGLGMFQDRITSLRSAIRYLQRHRAKQTRVGIDHRAATAAWLKRQHAKRFGPSA